MTTTIERGYPLVDLSRPQIEGVHRINAATAMVDGDVAEILRLLTELQDLVAAKAEAAAIGPAIAAAIDAIVAGAPAALDTLVEIADKLADNDDAVAAILSSLATKANAANVYSRASVDGFLAAKADRGVVEGHTAQLAALGAAGLVTLTDDVVAVIGGKYRADTSVAAIDILLPADPPEGGWVEVWRDGAEPITVRRNGHTIAGQAEDGAMNTDKTIFRFTFSEGNWAVQRGSFA